MSDQIDPGVENNQRPSQEVTSETNETAPANQSDDNIRKLISQRDKNFQEKKSLEEEVSELRSQVEAEAEERYKQEFLSGLEKDHPGVPRTVLEKATSPDHAKAIAEEWAKASETMREAVYKELTQVPDYRLNPEDAQKQLTEKKDTGDLAGALEIMLKTKR
jgi:hypothetical protein